MANKKRPIDANAALEKVCKNCSCDFEECKRIGFCVDYEDINQLPTLDAVPEWIPVSDSLPEDGTMVLVAYRNGDVKSGVSFSGFRSLSYGPDAWAEATHWMPLPEPPKGE